MTTRYIVKKCSSIGFASSFKNLSIKYSEDELKNAYFISESGRKNKYLNKNSISISEFETITKNNKCKGLVIVELGKKVQKIEKVPVEYDDDQFTIEDLDCSEIIEDEDTIAKYKESLVNFLNNYSFLEDKKLSQNFVDFLMFVYPNLQDGRNKQNILDLLHDNNIKTNAMEESSPIEYNDLEVDVVESISEFQDIKIILNKDDQNHSSSSNVYKPDKEEVKKAMVGNSTQLEAFSKNKFTVIHNKKSVNVESFSFKQNHDILSSLARNGVVCSPMTDTKLSVKKLVECLERFTEFDILFIHPSYELKVARSDMPSELIEPSYIINQGEILAVVYRYIVVNFFGYCSVYSKGMEELGYLI